MCTIKQILDAFPGMGVAFIAWNPSRNDPPTVCLVQTDIDTAILRLRLQEAISGKEVAQHLESAARQKFVSQLVPSAEFWP